MQGGTREVKFWVISLLDLFEVQLSCAELHNTGQTHSSFPLMKNIHKRQSCRYWGRQKITYIKIVHAINVPAFLSVCRDPCLTNNSLQDLEQCEYTGTGSQTLRRKVCLYGYKHPRLPLKSSALLDIFLLQQVKSIPVVISLFFKRWLGVEHQAELDLLQW